SRYETGSHIDLNSTNVAAGLSKKVKDNVTLGIFVEGGNGRYTTENEFEDGNVRADGDVNYFGGGIFLKAEGKKTAKGQLHGEASFRAGHMNSDYNSETFNPGESTRFDTSNAYMGAHAAVGYKWNVTNGGNIDTYVKYLWNRQNSDSPVIDGEQFDLDAINSHRLRAGFRYNGKETKEGIKFFGGLAYEYEFDGVAKGHLGEYALLEPDFKGGSGMAELGIKYHKPNSPWKVELGVTGYTGKRDSIGAHLNAWYEFGK
ncbi:MAG: autotransporter outer membrane beta-barrel domain-containing protein, partial [Synergistaceae bacterium]|nr:autotransporter outer membrane beta-barrel domain-containing protein [Candidatus Equadaptatus faecalis]